MKALPPVLSRSIIIALGGLAFSALSAQAQNVFTGGAGPTGLTGGDPGAYDFSNGSNWSGGAPNLQTSGTVQINTSGAAVEYYAGTYGDLVIKNGATLEITSGTFGQVTGGNWIQLEGNATMLVDGGTFNQGTDSNNPFQASGTNDLLKVAAGTVNFDQPAHFAGNNQVSYLQTGGTVNSSGEFDFNGQGVAMSGGILNVPQMTGVNGGASHAEFDLSGGTINLGTVNDGIYNGGTAWNGTAGWDISFTLGSTAQMIFASGDNLATVKSYVTGGYIQLNNTIDTTGTTDFNVVQNGNGTITVSLITASVPEPATWAALLSGAGFLLAFRRRR